MPIRSLHASLRGQAVDVAGKIINVGHDGLVHDADYATECALLSQVHNWAPALPPQPVVEDTVTEIAPPDKADGTVNREVVPVKRGRPAKVNRERFGAEVPAK